MQINYWQTFYEEGYYHIYNRSNGNAPIFDNIDDCEDFLERFKNLISPYCDTLAFCLMSNHFHFVLFFKPINETLRTYIEEDKTVAAQNFINDKTPFNDFIVAQFARLFQGFSKYYNIKYGRVGNLFQKKFKRIQQNTTENVVSRICYTHHNPIHHDAASFYDAYKNSSFLSFLSKNETIIAKKHTFYLFNEIEKVNINYAKKYFETGIFEYADNLDDTTIQFLNVHAVFHKEWLDKKRWTDFDEMED